MAKNIKNSNFFLDSEIIDVSVIIPVFNSEKYLVRCLDSVFNQVFSGKFEVIVVEDFSTDNSLQLLKNYKKNKPELRLVEHKKNKTLAQARTSGLKIAKGEYIMHVDADDLLLPNSIHNLYNKCLEHNLDVLVSNYITQDDTGEIKNIQIIKNDFETKNKISIQKYFYGPCWNKIVKRSILTDMVYTKSNLQSAEDLIYSTEILLKANKIGFTTYYSYCYFKNEDSITNSISPKNYLDSQIEILKSIDSLIKTYSPNKLIKDNIFNYFEKWIHLSICKLLFFNNSKSLLIIEIFENLFELKILKPERVHRISKSIGSKWYNLLTINKFFGSRYLLSLITKILINKSN